MHLLTFSETAKRIGFKSRTFVYEQLAEGTLPKPIRFGERALRFPSAEIDAVIKARIAGKSKAEIQALVKQLEADRCNAFAATVATTAPTKRQTDATNTKAAQTTQKDNGLQLVEG